MFTKIEVKSIKEACRYAGYVGLVVFIGFMIYCGSLHGFHIPGVY